MKQRHGAYILARYSTDRQNPDSIEVQVKRCSSWCEQNALPVLDVFADMAVSGMKDTRPQQTRMMQQLREGGADTVVIYDQSRMFRKMTAWFAFRDELDRIGVRVVSVTQPMVGQDLQDPANFLSEGTMALFNQMWSLQTRQKVIEKMRFMARNGVHTGGKPALGYQVVNGKLDICEAEAETVRRIFALYASGMSYRQIVRQLNLEGRKTKLGNSFGANSLHDLLRNEKYIGTLTYGRVKKQRNGRRNSHAELPEDAIRLENAIPAIIDRKTWEMVQAKMHQNQKAQCGRPPTRRDYPLKGKVFCGECGSAMYIQASGKTHRYFYYDCANKKRLHACGNRQISIPVLESRVAQAVREMLGEPWNTETLRQLIRQHRQKIYDSAAPQLAILIAREKELKSSIHAALDAVLSGLNSPSLTQKVNAMEAELQQIRRDMEVLKHSADTAAMTEPEFDHLLDELVDYIKASDAELLQIVYKVVVGCKHIQIWTLLNIEQDDLQKEAVLKECAKLMVPVAINPQFYAHIGLLVFAISRPKSHPE